MFLQDPDNIPPVLAIEVQAQAISHAGGPWTSGKGAGALLSLPQEAHIVHLRLVLRLTDWQPDPVDCWFRPVHASVVCHH